MQQFSIKSLERLSGIKAHTLRVWEQRYGILHPSRRESNHRVYSNKELKYLLRIVFLYQQGFKISIIAQLKEDEIDKLIQKADFPKKEALRAAILGITEAIIDFNEGALDEGIESIIGKFGLENGLVDVIFPAMNKLGILWMTDKLSPGQEHFASNLIIRKILFATDQLKIGFIRNTGRILLFTPSGEFHEISLLFVNYMLKINGHSTFYLGVNVPVEVIEAYYNRHHPTHLFVHFTTNLQNEPPEEYLKMLSKKFPQTTLFAAGNALNDAADSNDYTLLKTTNDLKHFCNTLQ